MKKKQSASIIIPVCDEEKAIHTVLSGLIAKGFHRRYDIIVVNDGSKDKTREIAQGFKEIRLINHSVNRGYGAALKTGIRAARTEKVIFMDSDGQHSPDKIDEIAEKLNDYPLVIGERDKSSHQVKNRLLGKWFISWLGRYLLGQKLPDFNSGFRGFKTRYHSRHAEYNAEQLLVQHDIHAGFYKIGLRYRDR